MGALETLWQFISGKPSQVAKSSKGGAGAVKPPILDTKFEDSDHKFHVQFHVLPKFCEKSFKMISRKKGATIDEIHMVVGNKRDSIYNHMYTIKRSGYDVVKTYDRKLGVHRYRLG